MKPYFIKGKSTMPRRTLFVFAALLCVLIAMPAWAQEKHAVTLFHFDLQQVAGGIPEQNWSEQAMEDLLITESFDPLLDIYVDHPAWKFDLEMQAYFLEVLEQRHSDVLEKLQGLAANGQASIMTSSYSGQLMIGYPRPAWEHSLQLSQTIFSDAGLPISKTVMSKVPPPRSKTATLPSFFLSKP